MRLRFGANLCKFLQVDMLWICLAVRLKFYVQNSADQPIYSCSCSHRLNSPPASLQNQCLAQKVYSLICYSVSEVEVAPEYVHNVLLIAIKASATASAAHKQTFSFGQSGFWHKRLFK